MKYRFEWMRVNADRRWELEEMSIKVVAIKVRKKKFVENVGKNKVCLTELMKNMLASKW